MNNVQTNEVITIDLQNAKVIFIPMDCPPYTHKVIVVSGGKQIPYWHRWEYNINKFSARYYAQKAQGKDNIKTLERTRKKEKQPEAHTKAGFAAWLQEQAMNTVGIGGTWRALGHTPINNYKSATQKTWKKTRFEWDDCYQNCPRWMLRFEHYCLKIRDYEHEIYGIEALRILKSKEWDKPEYDTCHW